MVKKIFLCLLISFPLLMPVKTRAGGLVDFLEGLFGKKEKESKPPTPAPTSSTSVPINGGMFLLMAGGLALGAKMLYDRKAKTDETGVA